MAEPDSERCTAANGADPTESARRAARFKFAQDRIKKIVDGMPPLTDEQLPSSPSSSTAGPVNDRTRAQDPGPGKRGSPTSANACMITPGDDVAHETDRQCGAAR